MRSRIPSERADPTAPWMNPPSRPGRGIMHVFTLSALPSLAWINPPPPPSPLIHQIRKPSFVLPPKGKKLIYPLVKVSEWANVMRTPPSG